MRKCALTAVVMIYAALSVTGAHAGETSSNNMVAHPEWYIKITDWSVYATWSAVAIIHNVTIENTSDVEYRDVKVRVTYTSMSTGGAGVVVSQETGVLPVTLPPRSKATYLKQGTTIGAASTFMNPHAIQVLGATPVTN